MSSGVVLNGNNKRPRDESSVKAKKEDLKSIPAFLLKTFQMVSDSGSSGIVSWNDKGDAFIVKNEHEFALTVLPAYFRHKNFSSFVRQLNFYGFRKRSNKSSYSQFSHPLFLRGQVEKLRLIKRKTTETTVSANVKDAISSLQSQVTELKDQYDHIWKIQHQILFLLSQFVRNPSDLQAMLGSSPGANPSKRPRLLAAGDSAPPPPPQRGRLMALGDGDAESPMFPIEPSTDLRNLAQLQEMVEQLPKGTNLMNVPGISAAAAAMQQQQQQRSRGSQRRLEIGTGAAGGMQNGLDSSATSSQLAQVLGRLAQEFKNSQGGGQYGGGSLGFARPQQTHPNITVLEGPNDSSNDVGTAMRSNSASYDSHQGLFGSSSGSTATAMDLSSSERMQASPAPIPVMSAATKAMYESSGTWPMGGSASLPQMSSSHLYNLSSALQNASRPSSGMGMNSSSFLESPRRNMHDLGASSSFPETSAVGPSLELLPEEFVDMPQSPMGLMNDALDFSAPDTLASGSQYGASPMLGSLYMPPGAPYHPPSPAPE